MRWEGLRSTPHGKTHGHKLSQAGQGGPVERRDTEIILLSGGIDIPKGSLTGGGDELDYLRECGFFFCGSETMRIGLGWQG
jgi:hypothetical protein